MKAAADENLVVQSLHIISDRAATRIQMLWRAKAATLTFLDRCSDARFRVQPISCNLVFESVLRRFSCSHLTSAAKSQAVIFSCVSSVVRSIVRTVEIARIVPISNRPFIFSTSADDFDREQTISVRNIQKVYRGHLARWIFVVLKEEVLMSEESSQDMKSAVSIENLQEMSHYNQSETEHRTASMLISTTESSGSFEESSMSKACFCIQRCWRGRQQRADVRKSLGFDISSHRATLKNLALVISERQQHEEYVRGSLIAQLGDDSSQQKFVVSAMISTGEQIDQLEPSITQWDACLQVHHVNHASIDTSSNIQEMQEKATESCLISVPKNTDAKNERDGRQDSSFVELHLEAPEPKQYHDDVPTQASIILIQRLARRWLGRRFLKARRMLLWRVRLIVQAAPAALRIQAVFRGHVGRAAYRTLWKWTNEPEPDHTDYSGIPTHFTMSESVEGAQSAKVVLPSTDCTVQHASVQRNVCEEHDLDPKIIDIVRSMYRDPEAKKYLLKLMLDAPLPIPSVVGRLPLRMLWKHGNDALNIPWMHVHVVPPHLQPCMPAEMRASTLGFSSDFRIPAEDDLLLVANPLETLAELLVIPYESILEGFSNGAFPRFVQMVEGRCKIVRSSMGIECVQALLIDLGMIRVLLSCAHTCLESFRYFRNQESPVSHWKSMEGLFRNQSESWIWLSSNDDIVKWCVCQDDASIKQRVSGRQIGFAEVADLMMKRCKACLDMSLFFLRNSCNQFPSSCSWVRAWYFSLQGLWYVTNGKQLSALQQLQNCFVELMCSQMRHSVCILQSSVDSQNKPSRRWTASSKRGDSNLDKGSAALFEGKKMTSVRPRSAISAIRPQSASIALTIERKNANRPISAASSFM
jgi:hypothetical protein